MPKKIILLFFVFFSLHISAQTLSQYNVKSLTVNDGLPQGFITGMVQDKQGFMWLSTNAGLARYDGKEIKVFYQDASDSNSLSTNVIRRLSIDRENNIWIQHRNGITDILNPVTEKFRHLSKEKEFAWLKPDSLSEHYKIFEDDSHRVYIIYFNKKLSKTEMRYFNWQQTKSQLISFPNPEYPVSINEDSNAEVWLTTNKALYVSVNHKAFKKKCVLPDELQVQKIPENISAFHIQITKENNFLINNLCCAWQYNIQNEQWKKIEFPSYIITSAQKDIQIAPDGSLYLADTNKIYKINEDKSLTLIWTNELKSANLSMMIDRSNVLWVATNTFGTRMIDLNYPGFNSVKIKNGFFQDALWAWNKIPVNNKRINTNTFNDEAYNGCSCFDKNGNLWFANFPYDKIDGQKVTGNSFIKITKLHTDIYNITKGLPVDIGPGVANLSFDAQNRCWAVLQNTELVQVDLQNKQYLNPFKLNNNNKIPNYLLATGNELCIVYPDALQLFNTNTKKIVWYKSQPNVQAFQNAYLLMAAGDPKNKNILWISSRGNGLIKFDTKTGVAKSFTTKDGLPNNTVYTLVADKNGYFWCSSNKGIFRFNPSDYSVLSFTIKDGLQGNEFNRYQYIQFPDDKIAFGGTEGYTIFDPDSIKIDNYQPAIALTDVAINNEPIAKYPAWNNKAIGSIDTMHLSYNQNFLTFHFAGMEYNNPEKLQYRYMLAGVDKNWVNAGTQNSANYTNLFPGSYDLKLNTSNTAGLWSSYIKVIHIIITPPWWKTWWAYSLYIAVIACLIFLFFRYRLRQIKAKQQIALQQKEAEQLKAMDELKSRFFSNITHEFRTPLSLIISPVEQMQQDINTSPVIKKNLSVVRRNARQLLRLINQLLDMSKLESGNMKLSLSRGNINMFIEECVQSFKQSANTKKIDLKLNALVDDEEYLFDADKMEKIIYNLLSNAIKFTPENGSITVGISVEENEVSSKLCLHISDTGIGIDEEKLPYIFDRFYQVDTSATRDYEGTGIGLALVKELVHLMDGTIEAKSKAGTGTVFNVVIPIKKAATEYAQQWSKPASLPEVDTISDPDSTIETLVKTASPLILVVEDNEELREFISQSLQKNYRTLTAPNGKKALAVAREELPDIIISDVMMPEMDGYTLCRKIKSDIVTDHIAVILLTAKAAHDSVIAGLTSGADDYITKPFHFDELQLRIHNALKRQEKLHLFFQSQLNNPGTPINVKEIENPFVHQLYTIIDEHLDDTTLTVEKLATKAAVSHRTLNRKLSSLIGLTGNELIKQYRLKRSVEFLQSGSNISEAAYKVGFETHSHFSTSFKSFFGVTPSEYANKRISK